MARLTTIFRMTPLAFLLAPLLAAAHGPVARQPDARATEARLFTADSSGGQVIAVDLPGGEVVTRLATPPFILLLEADHTGRYIFAMRGRDTDRDTITVIDSGFDASGMARFPTVARTFTGNAPGGGHDGFLATVGGRDAIFNESIGEIEVLEAGDFGSLGAIASRRIRVAAPDHYHYLEAGRYLYVGHLAKGFLQILDRERGKEIGRIGNCPVLHGMAADPTSGRLFFACMQNVLVVGTRGKELNKELARIAYPSTQRIGAFLKGAGRVLWGKTEGAIPALQRLDAAREPYQFETIPVDASIQQATSGDGRYLLVYSRNGTLDIRDGSTGALSRQLAISKPFDSNYHEHVDKALIPDIVTSGERAWISIPPEGVIVEIDMAAGQQLRRIQTGGMPTRLVLVQAPRATQAEARAR
jgi:hypothetical protein